MTKSDEVIDTFEGYNHDDILQMTFNLGDKTLYFHLNDASISKTVTIETMEKCDTFSMGIILGIKDAGAQLLSYRCQLNQ